MVMVMLVVMVIIMATISVWTQDEAHGTKATHSQYTCIFKQANINFIPFVYAYIALGPRGPQSVNHG
jgi:hypothetical protein